MPTRDPLRLHPLFLLLAVVGAVGCVDGRPSCTDCAPHDGAPWADGGAVRDAEGGGCVPNCREVPCGLDPVCGTSCGPCSGADAGLHRDSGMSGSSDAAVGIDAMPGDCSCPVPAHAAPECDAAGCGFRCDDGWKRDGEGCVENLACAGEARVMVTSPSDRAIRPTVAVAGDRIAVFWKTGLSPFEPSALRFQLFDRRTLDPVGEARQLGAWLYTGSHVDAIAMGERFVVAYEQVRYVGVGRVTDCRVQTIEPSGAFTDGAGWSFRERGCQRPTIAGDAARLVVRGRFSGELHWLALGTDSRPWLETTTAFASGMAGVGRTTAFDPERRRWLVTGGVGGGLASEFRVVGDVEGPVSRLSHLSPHPDSDVVFDGGGFAIVYRDKPVGAPNWSRHFQRLDPLGAPIGAPVDLGEGIAHAMAFGGGHHLVAIKGPRRTGLGMGPSGRGDLSVHFLDREGVAASPAQIIDDGLAESSWPTVAWDGESRFVVAHRVQNTLGTSHIELRAVCPPG